MHAYSSESEKKAIEIAEKLITKWVGAKACEDYYVKEWNKEKIKELAELLLTCHQQGGRNQAANTETWQDEHGNIHTRFIKTEFSVTWPEPLTEILPSDR